MLSGCCCQQCACHIHRGSYNPFIECRTRLDARRDAVAEYGICDLSGPSIAAALSDGGSQIAMFALLHPKVRNGIMLYVIYF